MTTHGDCKKCDTVSCRNTPALLGSSSTLVSLETVSISDIERNSLVAEIATTVVAGADSIGRQLAWIAALLAAHPHVTDKLLDELTECGLCGPELRSVAFDDLSEMPYLSAVVREGMRMTHVSTLNMPRIVPQDMKILGYRVPKGTAIFCPGDQAFSSKRDWGDPDTFRPERWLIGEDMSHKYNMPFLVGPRDCPGQRLAILELRVAIIEILRRYHISLQGTFEELKSNAKCVLVIEASEGIWINFVPRTRSG